MKYSPVPRRFVMLLADELAVARKPRLDRGIGAPDG